MSSKATTPNSSDAHVTHPASTAAAPLAETRSWWWSLLNTLTYALEWPILEPLVGRTYLEGDFAPVRDEVFVGHLDVIEGEIPAFLTGCFLRNGPNPYFDLPRGSYHWFDGDGMVHSVRIKDGSAAYSNRYVDTARLRQEKAAGYAAAQRFGKMKGVRGLLNAGLNKLKKMIGILDASGGHGAANTSLAFHAGRLLALHEGDLPYALRLACNGLVSTIGRVTYGGKVHHAFTAHPKVDPVTGEMFAFGYSVDTKPHCWYMRLDPQGRMTADMEVALPAGVMMHDFAMTERHVVFLDLPLLFAPDAMLKKGGLPFQFDKTRGMRFGVLDRYAADASGIKWFTGPPGMIFHVANAWEADDNRLEVYACVFDNFSLEQFTAVSDDSEPHLSRISLNLDAGASAAREAHVTRLTPLTTDFPQVPTSLVGRKSRYTYCGTLSTGKDGAPLFYGIAKFDLEAAGPETSLVGLVHHGEGRLGGEAFFVAKGNGGGAEDDGYLMTFVCGSAPAEGSELVVYDASTMSDTPVVRIRMPQRVPHGFHCTWVTEEQLRHQA